MGLSGHANPAAVLGVTISFTIIATFAVLLRLYSRIFIVHSPGKDDAFIAAACAMTICLTTAQCFQVKYGMGRHFDNLTPYEKLTSAKPFWASIVIYNLGLFLCKFSILLQYLRIFPYRLFRIYNYTLMAFIFAWSCWTVFSAIFFCRPVEYFWDKSIAGGTCLSQWTTWFTNAGVNIITDILVAILPLPFLNQLQLPKRQRIALMTVFALGGFTCIISILRLQSLLVFLHNSDISWHNPLAAIWSSLEVNIGILCSCLPTLKAMVSRYFPRAFNSSYLRGSGHSHERERGHQDGVGGGGSGEGRRVRSSRSRWGWIWGGKERKHGHGDEVASSSSTTTSPYCGSSGGSSGSGKQGTTTTDKPFSIEALGRGPGRDANSHKTTVRCEPGMLWGRGGGRGRGDYNGSGGGGDSAEEIEIVERERGRGRAEGRDRRERRDEESQHHQHGIRVVTVVEQEVEKGHVPPHGGGEDGKSEAGSGREVVHGQQARRGGEYRFES